MRISRTPIVLVLALAACGGGDGDSDATTTTAAPATTVAPVATEAPTTTAAPATTTTVPMVVEGATVVVANSSIVGGSAGRMTDQLARAGFTTGAATNGIDDLEDSVVYYTADDGAQPVAESLAAKLGGVEVAPMPTPVPTESGELDGGQVLLLLGNNQADRTLEELSGGGAATPDVDAAGAVVIVANASGVEGSAGRMTESLEQAGFTVGTATNATEQRAESIVYYSDAEGAQADAEALAAAMGGIEVAPLPDPVPTEDGELTGDVLLLLGTNEADQSLADLAS